MRRLIPLLAMLILVLHGAAHVALAQQGTPGSDGAECAKPRKLLPGENWVDPSPHRCGYVTVNGVRLHYLDWGGEGEPLVLLHGLGTSAHGFDDLAPRFTDRFRVLALTRRGHAESDHPESGYTLEQTTADVLGFLDALGLQRAFVAGHSIASAEATRLAIEHPHRVAAVVYLDGLPDWTEVDAILDRGEPKRPPPGDAFRSIETHREWLHRKFYGFWSPALEADFRYGGPSAKAMRELTEDAFGSEPQYSHIRVPVLAIRARVTLATGFAWLREPGADAAERLRAQTYIDQVLTPYENARNDRFRRAVPSGQLLVLEGNHYIHNSNLDEVASAMREFLLAQRLTPP